jgi:hypothetical protein
MLFRQMPIPASGVSIPKLNNELSAISSKRAASAGVIDKIVSGIRNNTPLSSDIIDAYYAGIPEYRGVIYINDLQLTQPLLDREFMIVAVDLNPDDNIIAHFVALRRDGAKTQYFNSYGTFVPAQIREFAERSQTNGILSSDRLVQPATDNSALCGYYCLFVIDQWRNGVSYADSVAAFKVDDKDNRHDIQTLIDHFNNLAETQ